MTFVLRHHNSSLTQAPIRVAVFAPAQHLQKASTPSALLLQDEHSAMSLKRAKSMSSSESLSSALKQLLYLELTSSFFAVDDCATFPFNGVAT